MAEIKTLEELLALDLGEFPAWIKPGVLPKGGILVAGGFTKIGKTFIALEMGHCLTTGKPMFGIDDFEIAKEPIKVLMIEQEVGEWSIANRLQTKYTEEDYGVPENRFYLVTRDPGLHLDTVAGRKTLEGHIEKSEANVVILDPISNFVQGDPNTKQCVQAVFTNLHKAMEKFKERGLSVIIIHHFRKPPQDANEDENNYDPMDIYQFSGSAAWVDHPDTLISCARRETTAASRYRWEILTHWVTRHMEEPGNIRLGVTKNFVVKQVERDREARNTRRQANRIAEDVRAWAEDRGD